MPVKIYDKVAYVYVFTPYFYVSMTSWQRMMSLSLYIYIHIYHSCDMFHVSMKLWSVTHYIYICICIYIHIHIHTYIHACKHACIHTCLLLSISMLWHRQAIFESKGDKLSSSAECRIRTHQGLRHQIASRLNAH